MSTPTHTAIAERYRVEITKLELARMWIRKQSPFYGALLGHIQMTYDNSIATACTNGKVHQYNREWFDALPSIQDQAFVMLHELKHDLLRHMERRGNNIPQIDNFACDYVVNAMLRDEGYTTTIPHLFDEKYTKPSIWTKEQVYADLMNNATIVQVKDFKPGDDVGGMGSFADAPSKSGEGESDPEDPDNKVSPAKSGADVQETDSDKDEAPAGTQGEPDRAISDLDITRALQAARLAQMQAGEGTYETDRLLANGENREDWASLLQHWVRKENSRFSYARPNKRFQGSRVVMPSLFSDDMPALVVSIDCSGSCANELPDFVANVIAIHEDVRPECTIVIYFTDKVCAVDRFYRDESIVINARYSGGTNFRPVFAKANNIAEEYEGNLIGHIMLTDCFGDWPKAEPEAYETLVISTSGQVAPSWAETVHYS